MPKCYSFVMALFFGKCLKVEIFSLNIAYSKEFFFFFWLVMKQSQLKRMPLTYIHKHQQKDWVLSYIVILNGCHWVRFPLKIMKWDGAFFHRSHQSQHKVKIHCSCFELDKWIKTLHTDLSVSSVPGCRAANDYCLWERSQPVRHSWGLRRRQVGVIRTSEFICSSVDLITPYSCFSVIRCRRLLQKVFFLLINVSYMQSQFVPLI